MREYSLRDAVNPDHPTSAKVGTRSLLRKLEQNQQHAKVVRSMLASDLAEHCLYVSKTAIVMTIVVDSSAWATLLRLDSKRLLKELRTLKDYAGLTQLRVTVNRRQVAPSTK
ncbi:MAG: DUF721 domain-containing protein [Gammaproteobacteria bacterium]|nr:DUF721 domain-containing protein [Gammaproteobacteria bacterium]